MLNCTSVVLSGSEVGGFTFPSLRGRLSPAGPTEVVAFHGACSTLKTGTLRGRSGHPDTSGFRGSRLEPVPSPQTNLRVLRRSNKKPRPGDIFVMQLPDETYLFGRVIGADLQGINEAPMPGSYLIYVYRHRNESLHPDLDQLVPSQLLIPPVFINRTPWTKGYFENVEHGDLTSDMMLPQHCFWDAGRGRYVDLHCNPLPGEVDPCGDWALFGYRWLDDKVSDALGIPTVPEG